MSLPGPPAATTPASAPAAAAAASAGAGSTSSRPVAVVAAAVAFVVALDPTTISVANPRIADSLHASLEGTQWITSGFLLAFTALLVPLGAVADRYGRGRVLSIGLGVFVAGSCLATLASSVGMLIAARVLQGAGAAAMQPAAIGAFRSAIAPARRRWAMGLWTATTVAGAAVAPVLAGAALGVASWRVVFAAVGGMAAVLLVAARVVGMREAAPVEAELPLHVGRNLLLCGGLGLLTWGLIRVGVTGWAHAQVLAPLAAAIVLLGAAGVSLRPRVKRPARPELDTPRIVSCLTVMTLLSIGFLGTVFLLSIFLQRVRGSTPLEVALQMLPFLGVAGCVAPLGGILDRWLGARRLLIAAALLEIVALYGLSELRPASTGGDLWPWLVLLGLSFGVLVPAILNLLMESAPVERSGFIGALQMSSNQLGGVLAVAVLGSIVASGVGDRFEANLAAAGAALPLSAEAGEALTQGIVLPPPGLDAREAAVVRAAGLDAFAQATGAARRCAWRWPPAAWRSCCAWRCPP